MYLLSLLSFSYADFCQSASSTSLLLWNRDSTTFVSLADNITLCILGSDCKKLTSFPLISLPIRLLKLLKLPQVHFSRIINGKAPITADMAIRLSKVLGRSPESWIIMQTNWDLWEASQKNGHEHLKRLPALSV